jgi:alpha-beta hydrolase superfamily lysophospholipase
MAKTVSPFVFTGIVAAAVGAANASGSFVQSIVDARLPLRGKPSDAQIQACMFAMADAWRIAGLDAASLKVYSSNAATLLSCPMPMLLEACEMGTGRNGVVGRVNAMMKPADSSKPKRGRPAGKGAGKTTAAAVAKPAAANDDSIIPKEGVSPMHRWMVALAAMNSGALIVRDANNSTMTAEDATAFQKLIKDASAIVGKYTAK